MTQQSDPQLPDDGPLWNASQTLKRMGGDTALLLNMISYFHEDAPELLNKLSLALEGDDTEDATRFAHSLKGLCATYDATAAVATSQRIEEKCRQKELLAAKSDLPRLHEQINDLSDALQGWQLNSA